MTLETAQLPKRDTARLIVLDPHNRLLLIEYEAARDIEAARPGERRFWYTPGGGVEPGESYIEAGARELFEEVGIQNARIGMHLANWNAPLTLFRRKTFTRSRFFLVRVDNDRLDTSQLAQTENDPVLDVRWWDMATLKASGQYLAPVGVIALVEAVISGRLPHEPVEFDCPRASSFG